MVRQRVRAVVLAAGRGTRMRRPAGAPLDSARAALADAGLKALIPFHGHPYLAYVLSELATAGYVDVCLVVGPGDDPIRAVALRLPTERLRLEFAVQTEPRGVADAVLAAEGVVGDEPFVVINADNVYPAAALAALRELDGPGLIGFDRAALIARSNIPAERVAAYALIVEADGWVERIIEKPDPETARRLAHARVSMTCWRFDASIFEACRTIAPSERGELELPDAVQAAIARGARYRVVPMEAGVLDLSNRGDVAAIEKLLKGREVRL